MNETRPDIKTIPYGGFYIHGLFDDAQDYAHIHVSDTREKISEASSIWNSNSMEFIYDSATKVMSIYLNTIPSINHKKALYSYFLKVIVPSLSKNQLFHLEAPNRLDALFWYKLGAELCLDSPFTPCFQFTPTHLKQVDERLETLTKEKKI